MLEGWQRAAYSGAMDNVHHAEVSGRAARAPPWRLGRPAYKPARPAIYRALRSIWYVTL